MKIKQIEGVKHFATALLSATRKLQAEFLLDGADTYIKIYEKFELENKFDGLSYLPIILADGTRLSFLQSVPIKRETLHYDGGSSFYIDMRPHFVLVGHMHFNELSKLETLSVLVDDAAEIFYEFDVFGHALKPDAYINAILASEEKIVERRISRGNHPIVAYYTGKSLVFSTDISGGNISASHRVSYTVGNSKGIHIEDEIYVDIKFLSPALLSEAMSYLSTLL